MVNFWLVARHEYLNTVARRGFILVTLAVPIGFAALIGLGILVATIGQDSRPVGYVDNSGLLVAERQSQLEDAEDRVQLVPYNNVLSGTSALEDEYLQALFVLPADYPANLQTTLYYLDDPPSSDIWHQFDDFVRLNLVAGHAAEAQVRLIEGPAITVEDIASGRTYSQDAVAGIILPFVATFLFLFATMSASGYLLRVVAGEKENRTMEIMITSMSPWQLIGGKAAGLLAATLTQMAIYILAAVIAVRVAGPFIPELQLISIPWDYVAIITVFFVPAYAFVAAIMIAIGAAVTEIQQGQQIAGILSLLFTLPLFLLAPLMENSEGAVATVLTLFPTTSFLTVSLRWSLGAIPYWQMILSWLILTASAILMSWAASRVFRAGMLRYGQPLNLRSALSAIRYQ